MSKTSQQFGKATTQCSDVHGSSLCLSTLSAATTTLVDAVMWAYNAVRSCTMDDTY